MMDEESESISYLSAADIRDIHELIVESMRRQPLGTPRRAISNMFRTYSRRPFRPSTRVAPREGIPVAAAHCGESSIRRWQQANSAHVGPDFLRLEWARFDYDQTIKEILKALATDEAGVDENDVIEYLQAHTEPLAPEYESTINLWLARIEGADELSTNLDTVDQESHELNDYDHDPHSEV